MYVGGYGTNLVSDTSGSDWLIKKFDSSGTEDVVNWNKNYSGTGDLGADYIRGIAVDSNNNVYVVGSGTNLFSEISNDDWWIKKFNSNGVEDTTYWNKTIDYANDEDIAYSITVDSNSNVYVVGHGTNLVSEISSTDWWIKKFNNSGVEDTINWNKTIDIDSSDLFSNSATSVTVDSNNNVYVGGSGLDPEAWWIKKFDSSGVEDASNWNKSSIFGSFEAVNGIAIDSNNNVYVVGAGANLVSDTSGRDWLIKKYSASGVEDVTWNKTFNSFGGYDQATAVAIDSNNNVYVVGYGSNVTSDLSYIDWVVKRFSSAGVEDTVNWNQSFNSVPGGYDHASSVAIDSTDDVYVGGDGYDVVGINDFDWWIKKFEGYTVAPAEAVPEFEDYAMMFIVVIGISGFFVMKKRN